MTIARLLHTYRDIEIELLLAHVLLKDKEFLYLNPHHKITAAQQGKIARLVKRRKNLEPIAYILGYKYFYGLKFKVSKQVLIPRPETEWLVDQAIKYIKRNSRTKQKFSLLDMGTGSGCIPISIAQQLQIKITASDISANALKVATQNANAHHANINFIKSDLFKNTTGKFDVITANLPYVPQGMYELLHANLQYEPKQAITDGTEDWNIYKRFFTELPKYLKPHGVVFLEIDDGAKPELEQMIKMTLPGWKVKFHKDLNNLWRYIDIRRKTA